MDKNNVEITVFSMKTDGTFEPIGDVNQFDSVIWPSSFIGPAQAELWAPITDENNLLFQPKNVLWAGGTNAAIIEIIKPSFNQQGVKVYDIKGNTLECLLKDKIIWGTYNAVNKRASTVMWEIVNQNCVNPINPNRKTPFLVMDSDPMVGPFITKQITGGEVLAAITAIAKETSLGFDVTFDPVNKILKFVITVGVDRTLIQTAVDPVEISTDMEDLLSSEYYFNSQDEKNVALVAGEGEGADRTMVVAGDNDLYGFERKEQYVDGRDLQSEFQDEDGNTVILTPTEYADTLVQRGNEKNAERFVTETYQARIRVYGGNQFEYGRDYFKGDKVTITDKFLNKQVHAVIDEVEEGFDKEYSLTLTFGFQYPTILQKVNRVAG